MDIDNYTIRELYGFCRTHKVKGFKRMTKEEIFKELKNKNIFNNIKIELQPGKLFYFVLWYPNKPVMYSFTNYYKGMLFSGHDEKTIKSHELNFDWNKKFYVTSNIDVKEPNIYFFGSYPSSEDKIFNNYFKFRKLNPFLFYLNKCTNSGYIFNYMKEGCSLEVKFIHTLYDKDYIKKMMVTN